MDEAAKGASALTNKDFAGAIKHYSVALASNPQAVDYYIKRSTAYTRTSPSNPLLALFDAETAVVLARQRGKRELIAQAQLRRGVALFSAERWGDAGQCFDWARKLSPSEKSLDIWDAKVKAKLEGMEAGDDKGEVRVVETPNVNIDNLGKAATSKAKDPAQPTDQETKPAADPAPAKTAPEQTPASKIRHDWYQSSDAVTVTLMAKGVPKDKAKVELEKDSLTISFPLATGSDFQFSLYPLFAHIDASASSYKVMSSKVEFVLKKAEPGKKWATLEAPQPPPATHENGTNGEGATTAEHKSSGTNGNAPAAPAYPSSSKHGPKDWDKLAADLTKKPKKPKKKEKEADGDGTKHEHAHDHDHDDEDEDEDEDPYISDDGGDPVNAFFKKLYKDATPDTRRAMMKSYQESNGTALSTNWAEVSKGTVETNPPDGMEAKQWGQ